MGYKNSGRYKSSSVKTHRHPCKSWNSRKKCGIGKWQIAKHFDQTFFTFDDMACLSGVWEHYRSLHGVREGKGLELELKLKLKTNSCLKSLHCSVVSMSGCIVPIMDESLYELLRDMAMQKRRQPLLHAISFFMLNQDKGRNKLDNTHIRTWNARWILIDRSIAFQKSKK